MIGNMALSIMNAVSSFAPSTSVVGQKAFAGSRVPLAPRVVLVQRSAIKLTPQALFTKNKANKKTTGTKYDQSAVEVDPAQPAFTRRREVFAGRLAMFGFAASLIGELYTGKGVLGQLALETGLPSGAVDLLLLGIIGYNFVGGLRPGSPTFSEENQRDVQKRRKGAVQDPKINAVSDPKGFFGISEKGFGFTKKNEVFVGRTAQLGFLASVIGEKVTGRGPLTQFGLETGIPLGAASVGLIAFISFFLVAAVLEGNYGPNDDDEDTY